MMTRHISSKILSAFAQADSKPEDVVPRLFVSGDRTTNLSLSALEGPFRDLGYIVLPRLTLTADSLGYFSLGCLLVNCARHAAGGQARAEKIDLQRTTKAHISTLVLNVWSSGDICDDELRSDGIIVLNRDVFWLSPLSNFGINEGDSPIAGIIRRHICDVSSGEYVPHDGSAMYLSMSTRGAIALGKTLILFAIDSSSESAQFEQDAECGGGWANEL